MTKFLRVNFLSNFVTNFHSVENKSKVGIYKGIRTMFQKYFWCKMLPAKYREVSSVENDETRDS